MHNIEKSKEIAAETLSRLEKEGLTPIPENYELWYSFYAKSNPDVVQAIEIMEENADAITDDSCLEIYSRFLSDDKEQERVREAGDRIQNTINDVTGIVDGVKNATSKYNSTLEGISGKLTGDMSNDEMKGMLDMVMTDTKSMMEQNRDLEDKLSQSAEVMDELKQDLERMRKEAMTDSLTKLANRKAFDTALQRIAAEAEEEDVTFSLLMMDIDHFKSFNDNFGHQVGDQVLRLVAQTLTDGVKGRDVAARYGGEEFAIILPETGMKGGVLVGDALRRAVANKEVINRNTGDKLGRITLSGGVGEYIPGEPIEELIARADAALYTAKNNGRNQIAASPTPGQQQAAS